MDDLDTSTGENEVSMDDTIRQTLEAINARGADEAVGTTEEVTEESTEEPSQEGRVRDENGRFKPKAEQPAEEVAEEAPQEEQKPVETVSVPPELQRLGLKKEEAEAIASNPVAMQAFMRRSEEMHRGLEMYREKAQFGDAMQRAIAPFQETFKTYGVSPDVAVQKLFMADQMLRTGSQEQKAALLHQLAKDYQVDIGMVSQVQESPFNPQVYQLQSQLQQMQSWIEQQNQAREWQERQTLNSEIEKFASDPSNAYFQEVKAEMAGLLQAGLATDLKDAYDRAVYANPQVRAKVLAQQQAEAEAQRRAQAAQKAQAAKAAASVNVVRKGTLPAAKAIGTMDDTIRETAAKLGLIPN